MANYDFKTIEKKWQDRWEKEGTFRAIDDFSLPKFYGLIEFPYPSGAGMHVGHIKAYSGMEVICRKRRMQGYNVLFPIGFDAFGLPAENYAIKTGRDQSITDRLSIVHIICDLFTRLLLTCLRIYCRTCCLNDIWSTIELRAMTACP